MGILRSVSAVVSFLCVFVVIYGGPIFRIKFGWSPLVITAIQLASGALALCLVGREAYRQASKEVPPGSKPKLVTIVGLSILGLAFAAAMFIGRRS